MISCRNSVGFLDNYHAPFLVKLLFMAHALNDARGLLLHHVCLHELYLDIAGSKEMSEAPQLERQSSESRAIPERRVVIKDPAELPNTYSQTPGGTIFSTTPGGTQRTLIN